MARDHLACDGAAALSLRPIARDLGLAPSALYRYFDGRDALLSALILAAYESLAQCAEEAADQAARQEESDSERFAHVPRAIRRWALARPYEWGHIRDARSGLRGARGHRGPLRPHRRRHGAPGRRGQVGGTPRRGPPPCAGVRPAAAAVAPVTEGLFPGTPAEVVVVAVQAWTTMIGAVSLEVFGHWRRTILDPDLYFERTVADLAAAVGLGERLAGTVSAQPSP